VAGTGKYLWIMVVLQAAISASSLVVEIVAGRMIALIGFEPILN
jgi:hypothetical protein